MKTTNYGASATKTTLKSFASKAPAMQAQTFKMSKGIRKQLFNKCVEKYVSHDGYEDLKSILPEDVYPWDVYNIVTEWLDVNCSNGHFSRWTNFGEGILADALNFEGDLYRAYEEFGFICW